jgi:hypothetical protein
MKRWLMVLMATVLSLCLVGSALAAGVPKTLCYSLSSDTELSMLLIKSAGSIKTATGTIKYYSISGTHFNHKGNNAANIIVSFPVTGSGYLLTVAGKSSFHFTYTGMNSFHVGPYDGFHAEGLVPDLTDLSKGQVCYGYFDYGSNFATEAHYSVYSLHDPTTVAFPFSIQDPGQEKPE